MLANNVPDASFRAGTAPSGRICWSNGLTVAAGGVPAQLRGGSGAAPGAPCRVSTPMAA